MRHSGGGGSARVYLCVEPVDFRKSIRGLSLLVEQALGLDPFQAAFYAFTNRRRDRIRILYWDRNGFCLWYKVLEEERFRWPEPSGAATVSIDAEQLGWLLDGFDLWRHRPHRRLQYRSVG